MTFAEWWESLPPAEQKLLGVNNASFVWAEAQKNMTNVLALPNFILSRFGEQIAIMSRHGEGGAFHTEEFDHAVSRFFAEKF